MRAKILFVVFLMMVTCLPAFSQGIDLKLKDVTVEKAIATLNRTGNYSIVLNSDAFDLSKVISVNAQNASINDVLVQIFSGQNASFKIDGKKVIVSKAQSESGKYYPADSIKGCVMDSNGEPVIGASVVVKGKELKGTSTDLDGNFSLDVAPGTVLTVSSIGYLAKEVTVGKESTITISLSDDKTLLDEVIVVGYGTQRKRDLTGSITHINASELQGEAPNSVQDIIRGGVAGVNMGLATDVSGDAAIQIRGKNTLSAGSSPLLVLDGVVFNGSLVDLNPADIESIDVLKDASSAAIYGAKAASGVIMITTKRGSESGKPQINLNANVGMAQAARVAGMMDADDFIQFRQDYFDGLIPENEKALYPERYSDPRTLSQVSQLEWYNYGLTSPVSSIPADVDLIEVWLFRLGLQASEIENFKAGRITDWDELFYPKALQQDYTVSVSNRNDKSSYYTSVGFINREGTTIGSGYKSVKGRINFDTNVTKWLTTGVNAQFTARDKSEVPAAYEYRPFLNVFNANEIDNLDSPYRFYCTQSSKNPFAIVRFTDKDNKDYVINLNLYAKVKLPWGFEFQTNYSPRLSFENDYQFRSAENPIWGTEGGKVTRSHYNYFNWQLDNVLRWNKTFGEHHFEMTLLQNAEKNQYWSTVAQAASLSPSAALGFHYLDAGQSHTNSSYDEYSTADALMARLFYQWKSRYLLTVSIRRDGYSAFGQSNPYATFPSVALGWIFSEEKFASSADWLDFGKFRVSYGVNGNRDIGIYSAISQMTSGLYMHVDENGSPQRFNYTQVTTMNNANLKWERTSSFNVGLDFALFNGFVDGSIDAYSNETSDLLMNRTLPLVTGYKSVYTNLGLLGNKGIEVSVNLHPINNMNFKWDSGLTFSANRRKILSLYGEMEDVLDENGNVIGQKESDDRASGWYIGHDTNEIFDYEEAGVWQVNEAEEAAKYGNKPGDFHFVDKNGDGVLDYDDKVFTGRTVTPKYIISWRNDFTLYKNFSIAFSMYAKLGMWGACNRVAYTGDGTGWTSRTMYDLPYWTPENPTNEYARINSLLLSNHWVNRSFVRMDNISLKYNIPTPFLGKINIHGASISLNARNPFCITKWPSGDPENLDNPDYSLQSFTLGLNLTL